MGDDFERALATAQGWVGSVPGVIGVAEGREDDLRTIEVWTIAGGPRPALPAQVGGHPVIEREGEEFRALDPPV